MLLGFLIGSSRLAYTSIYPLMIGFNALPKAAFVPILVVWFGIGSGPAILTAFLISFFPITVNIATGLATLEPELEDVLRVLGAKRWDVLVKVGLPRSMPYFYGSLKVAITLAFVGTMRVRDDRGQRRHRLPADLGRLVDADGPGLRRAWWSSARWRWRCTSCSRWSRSAPPAGRTAARKPRADAGKQPRNADPTYVRGAPVSSTRIVAPGGAVSCTR